MSTTLCEISFPIPSPGINTAKLKLSPREKTMIQYGGLLNAIKELGGDF